MLLSFLVQGLCPYEPPGLPPGLCRGSISPAAPPKNRGGWASPIVSAHHPRRPFVAQRG